MISIIVCSVSPERLEAFKINVKNSIGNSCQYEFVVIDNRETNYPITKAYNIGAKTARFELLCFAHEDIVFLTPNWGETLEPKLSENNCGVIGFAGATVKTKELSGWSNEKSTKRINLKETSSGISTRFMINPRKEEFSEVVTLDGLCLFTTKHTWEKIKFDEVSFDGFHLYDLDFSTAVYIAGYKNYVCHNVLVEHLSKGSFGETWFKYSKIYHAKWREQLPIIVNNEKINIKSIESKTLRKMTSFLIKKNLLEKKELKERLKRIFRHNPLSLKHFYLKYRYDKANIIKK